jgi:glycosyltransferase involved in cell wall biosynthesis
LLVRPDDAEALAGAMARLIDDPAARARMGAAARQKVSAFKAATVIPRIEAIYRSLLEGGHR